VLLILLFKNPLSFSSIAVFLNSITLVFGIKFKFVNKTDGVDEAIIILKGEEVEEEFEKVFLVVFDLIDVFLSDEGGAAAAFFSTKTAFDTIAARCCCFLRVFVVALLDLKCQLS
jgi:hypothetical protein